MQKIKQIRALHVFPLLQQIMIVEALPLDHKQPKP